MVSSLVSCAWLKQQLDEKRQDIRVLDGTFHSPQWKRDAHQEYLEQHIEGAVRFDLAEVRDKSSPLPHMLPPASQFEEQVGKMGISNDTHVVIYDNNATFGFYSAGRPWWMFKVFAHEKVSILDGGLPKWIAEGLPTVCGPQGDVAPCSFRATYNPSLVHNMKQMMGILSSKSKQARKVNVITVSSKRCNKVCEQFEQCMSEYRAEWVDARPKGMFDGTAPDPNKTLHSGHILGTTNIPFFNMIDSQTKTLKDKAGLQQEFEKAGIDLSKPLVVSCGGGLVSVMLAFAAHLLGKEVAVYDGSWTEWVQNAPKETMHLGVKGEDLK